MALIIGDLRYLIQLYGLNSTKDEYGSDAEAYSLAMTLRSGVKFVSGNKGIDLEEVFTSQTIQFTTHYRSTIVPTMVIVYAGQQYRILAISTIGFKEGLLITTELMNAGDMITLSDPAPPDLIYTTDTTTITADTLLVTADSN